MARKSNGFENQGQQQGRGVYPPVARFAFGPQPAASCRPSPAFAGRCTREAGGAAHARVPVRAPVPVRDATGAGGAPASVRVLTAAGGNVAKGNRLARKGQSPERGTPRNRLKPAVLRRAFLVGSVSGQRPPVAVGGPHTGSVARASPVQVLDRPDIPVILTVVGLFSPSVDGRVTVPYIGDAFRHLPVPLWPTAGRYRPGMLPSGRPLWASSPVPSMDR